MAAGLPNVTPLMKLPGEPVVPPISPLVPLVRLGSSAFAKAQQLDRSSRPSTPQTPQTPPDQSPRLGAGAGAGVEHKRKPSDAGPRTPPGPSPAKHGHRSQPSFDARVGTSGLTTVLSAKQRSYLVDGEGIKLDVAATLKGKVVALYFAALSCPACHAFTPLLLRTYAELAGEVKPFEVVYVSEDDKEEDFNAMVKDKPWLAIPWSDRESKAILTKRFDVRETPTLIVVDGHGKVINRNGVAIIRKDGPKGYPFDQQGRVDPREQATFDKNVLELFQQLDIDGNKVVTGEEVLKRLELGTVPSQLIHSFAEGIMADMDKDKNASISQAEWQAYFKTLQKKMGGAPFPLDGFQAMFGLKKISTPRLVSRPVPDKSTPPSTPRLL